MDDIQADKSNKIDDALLAVPQLQKSYQGKRNLYLDELIKSPRICPETDSFLSVNRFVDLHSSMIGTSSCILSVEKFESLTDCCASCNIDDVDVIPSSYPDSEVCFDLEISLDSPVCASAHSHSSHIFECECFTEKIKEGRTLSLEEPITQNSFEQVASKIFSTSLLLKRLQMYVVEDPFYESTGKPWMEQNVFKQDDHLNCVAQVTPKPIVSETYAHSICPGSQKKNNEELLTPYHKRCVFPLYLEDFCNIAKVISILHCQQDDLNLIHGSLLVQVQGYETFTFDPAHSVLLNTHCVKSFVDTNNEDAKSQCVESSPVISFMTDQIATKDDITEEFCKHLEKKFDWSEEEIPAITFLSCESIAILRQEVTFTELHYDRARLSEPVLYQTPLPDPVEEALQHLNVTQMKNKCLIMESYTPSTNLSKELHLDLIDPLTKVSIVKTDCLKICVFPVEEHIKLNPTKEDAPLDRYNGLKQDSSLQKMKEPQEIEMEEQNTFPVGNCPLNAFMLCRKNTFEADKGEQKETSINMDKAESDADLIDLGADLSCPKYASKVVKVPFTGPYKDVMRNVMEYMSLQYAKVRQCGNIPHNQNFMNISVDQMRFIYKEAEQLYSKAEPSDIDSQVNERDKRLLGSYARLLHVKITLDLLVHGCLESAITHLSSCMDSDHKNCDRSLLHLHEELYKIQIKFMESNCNHPKFMAVTDEINRFSLTVVTGNKVLIVVQKGLFSLQYALDRMLHKVSPLPVYTIHGIKSLEELSAKPGITILLEDSELDGKTLEQFSLILHYDASNLKLKGICDAMEISYIGFVSEVSQTSDCILSDNFSKTSLSKPLTVISSIEVTQHKRLVYSLEARYNILILERNYLALKEGSSIYYADLILGFHHSIVLLALHEMSSQWNLEAFITRLVAVGFQCSFCFILAHGMGAPSRYLLDKSILLNLYKLRASLSNLSRSSMSFSTVYKVIICSNEDDVAINVRAVADETLDQQTGDLASTPLTTEMSKEEAFLLQLVCFNSYRWVTPIGFIERKIKMLSAQKFLSFWTLNDLIKLQAHDIRQNIPDISDNFVMMFEQSLPKLKYADFISVKPELPHASSVTSNISYSPAFSNDKGSVTSEVGNIDKDDHIITISSEDSTNSISGNVWSPELCERNVHNNVQCLKHDVSQIFHRRNERSPIRTIQLSSYSQKSHIEIEGIVSQSEEETRSSRKRPAVFNKQSFNTEIARKMHCCRDFPSNVQIVSNGENNNERFLQIKDTDMKYLAEKEKTRDNSVMDRFPGYNSSSRLPLHMGRDYNFFDQKPCNEVDVSKLFYADESQDSFKYCNISESDKNVSFTGKFKSSYPKAHEPFSRTFEKETPQWENLDTAQFTTLTPPTFYNYEFGKNKIPPSTVHKSDETSNFSSFKANERRKANTYGIFSEKIYRTKEHNSNTIDKQSTHFISHPLPSFETNARSTTYLHPHYGESYKRDCNVGNDAFNTSQNMDSDILDATSLPFRVSKNLRKYIDQKENSCRPTLQDSLLWYRSQTDSSCGSGSRVTLGKTNQCTRNAFQTSSFSSVSEQNLKNQEKMKASNFSLLNDIFSKDEAYRYENRQQYSVPQGQTAFERYTTNNEAHVALNSMKEINTSTGNLCNESLLNTFKSLKNDSQKLRKQDRLNDAEKPSNLHRWMEKSTLPFLTGLDMNKDLLHLPQKSDNFDVTVKQSQQ